MNLKKLSRTIALAGLLSVAGYIALDAILKKTTDRWAGGEVQIEMSLSAPGGAFEVYANTDFGNPRRVDTTVQGRRTYRFFDMPTDLQSLRMNPIDKDGLTFAFHQISFLQDGRNILDIGPGQLSQGLNLSVSAATPTGRPGEFTSTTNDPTFYFSVPVAVAQSMGAHAAGMRHWFAVAGAIAFALLVLLLLRTPGFRSLRVSGSQIAANLPGLRAAGPSWRKFLGALSGGVRKSTVPELDGLRGVAALIVVLGHYSNFSPVAAPMVSAAAKHGVWLFFILSSYLLSYLFQTRLATRSFVGELGEYIPRRFLRIFPMYYVCLLLLYLVPPFMREMFGGRDLSLLDHALLIYPEGILWSISAEFEFYFFLPLFVAVNFLLRSPGLRLAYQAALVVGAFYFANHWLPTIALPPNYPHVWPYLPTFVVGTALGLFQAEVSSGRVKGIAPSVALVCFIAGAAGVVLTVPGIAWWIVPKVGTDIWYHYAARPFHVSCFWALTLAGVLYGGRYIAALFSFSWLRFAGLVSYSVYLNHILVMALLSRWLYPIAGFIVTGIVTVIVIYLLSTVTYLFVEYPFMRLRPNFGFVRRTANEQA